MIREGIKLTQIERLLLYNQYLILEALYPDEAKGFQEKREIIECGYESHYNDLNLGIIEAPVSVEVSGEVMDILDMYAFLKSSYSKLDNPRDINEKQIEFDGFDGNNESDRLAYARFLILTQGRWKELRDGRPGFDFNSHYQTIDIYRRMLKAWFDLGKKPVLSIDEMKQILDERIHPDSRS